ncbi:hypothetical protein QYF36_006812 [Acer negundo]|nr:hypothetical protein QYF36_006812 [Acer negundo]
MTTNAAKLQALEAENAAIRVTNEELRALVDSVIPDSETTRRPVPILNNEQERTLPPARVEIDLIDLPLRNKIKQDLNVGRRPKNVSKAPPLSIQSTPGLVKSGFELPMTINSEFSRRFSEIETLIQRIPGVPAPIKKSTANSFADSPFVDDIALTEMPRKFNFPNMKQYEGTTDPNDHIAQYKQ